MTFEWINIYKVFKMQTTFTKDRITFVTIFYSIAKIVNVNDL